MDPSFQFRQWSTRDAAMLLKSRGTIKDIDGDYSFVISGKPSHSCSVVAHYRLPLRAINKKFGLYRKIVNHLTQSSHPIATQLRDTYLSIMDYIHNVRVAFCTDARRSPNPLDAGFRSTALDYYLWLDHMAGGFHNECRMKLKKDHDITLKSIKNQEGKDIIPLLDWCSYHANNCREYDLCEAFQGNVYQENIQRLLDAVDSSMDAGRNVQESSSPATSHDIDTDRQPMLEVDDMQNSIDRSLESVDDNLNVVCSAVESAPQAVFDTMDGDHIVDESITTIDALPPDENAERIPIAHSIADIECTDGAVKSTESAEYQQSSLRPFPHPFDWSYCRRAINTMGVQDLHIDLSQWLIAYIVIRMRELHGLDEDTPLKHVIEHGSDSQVNYEQHCELHGISKFLSVVQLIRVERQSMSQFFQSAARGLTLTGLRVDCAIQCDADSAGESPDQVHLCSNDDSINHQESDLVVIPEVKDAACIQDSSEPPQMESDCAIEHVSTTSPRSLDPSFTLDIEQPCMGSDDWMTVAVESGIDLLDCIAHDNSKHKDAVSESSPVDNLAVRGRLRPRKLKDGKPRATFAKTRHRGNSPSEHHVIVNQQGSGRPIIYARSQLQSNSKKRKASPAIKYTLDDLMKESRKDHKDIPPYIHSFLIDPKRDAFIESNISAEYHLLLDVARFVASTLSKKSLSDTLMPSALSLMKIEYWLHDVAEDCKKALEADDITLSHLAQHGLIELSKRASIDAVSLSAALKIYMSKHQNSFKAFSTVTRYLCKLRASHPGADIQYEPGFKVLARMITAHQKDK